MSSARKNIPRTSQFNYKRRQSRRGRARVGAPQRAVPPTPDTFRSSERWRVSLPRRPSQHTTKKRNRFIAITAKQTAAYLNKAPNDAPHAVNYRHEFYCGSTSVFSRRGKVAPRDRDHAAFINESAQAPTHLPTPIYYACAKP